jgi:O-phospho-L-seryl-tRNASec:L-selenocysteinyl-tRNA synthase
MTLTLLTLKQQRPDAQYVLWPRIDQKSCFKAILTSGFKAVVIPMKITGDEVHTDMEAIEAKIAELGAESVLCVLSTTSCFSPRCPDDVESIAKVCAKTGVCHVINNAYGLQSSKACHIIDQACRRLVFASFACFRLFAHNCLSANSPAHGFHLLTRPSSGAG